jgi:hypothetical protein
MNQHREPLDDALERLLAEFISEEEAGKTPRIDEYAKRLADGEQRRRLFELHDSLASVRSTFHSASVPGPCWVDAIAWWSYEAPAASARSGSPATNGSTIARSP